MLADCLHDLTALGSGGLLGAMALAGLAGGATHCTTMCAPFVLAQAATGAGAGGGTLRRLAGAALLPYQLGRAIGYGALGALAGGAAGLMTQATGVQALLPTLLLAAALLMFAAAAERLLPSAPRLRLPAMIRVRVSARARPGVVARRVGALLAAPGGGRGVLLGVLLSALPCGLLYGALAGAAAAGSALAGALAMVAFVAGTVPAMAALALLGRFFGRRHGVVMRRLGGAAFALNGVVLLGLALRGTA